MRSGAVGVGCTGSPAARTTRLRLAKDIACAAALAAWTAAVEGSRTACHAGGDTALGVRAAKKRP